MIIASVLKQGKDFGPKHAQWLHKQLTGYSSICLTDVREIAGINTIPLQYDWPSWWGKIELFNPNHPVIGHQDILYFDLDTVIVGDIKPLMQFNQFIMLRDFLKPHSFGSGVMFIPVAIKKQVWDAFMQSPQAIMDECTTAEKWGDQGFISSVTEPKAWQDVLPGAVLSYKGNITTPKMRGYDPAYDQFHKTQGKIPPNAAVVCFHGYPRPWQADGHWIPSFCLKNTLSKSIRKMKSIFR